MAERIITLTTDFGWSDGYVGAMKGVIASICPSAQVHDLAHEIPPQNIVAAALVLEAATGLFPPGTIHVAVIDPGVGSARPRLLAMTSRGIYVGPDNGVFSLVFRRDPPEVIISLENEKYFLPGPATTFDGRDVFAPVAAYCAAGVSPDEFGPAVDNPVALPWPEITVEDCELTGGVVGTDHFGNIIFSIRHEDIPHGVEDIRIRFRDLEFRKVENSYVSGSPKAADSEFRILFGSMGYLELALPGGSADECFRVTFGEPVRVSWSLTVT